MLIIFTHIVIVCQKKKSGKQTKLAEIFLTELLKASLNSFMKPYLFNNHPLYTQTIDKKGWLLNLPCRKVMSQAGYDKDWKLSESSWALLCFLMQHTSTL